MRNKAIFTLTALVLCMSAFFMPLTAYAASDTTPPTVAAWLNGGTLHIEASDDDSGVDAVYVDGKRINYLVDGAVDVTLKDYAGNAQQVSIYAIDFAGNQSSTVKIANPYYEAPASATGTTPTQTQPKQPTVPSGSASSGGTGGTTSTPAATPEPTATPEPGESAIPSGNTTLTPDGQASVVDNVTEDDGKEFFTFTTPAGNVFYLIVDRQRTDGGVYFLNAVTESDLMALAEQDGESGVSAIPDPTPAPMVEPEPDADPEPEPEPEQEKSGGSGSIVFIIIALLAVGGAGYYFKILRPKQQAAMDIDDDYEEYEEEEPDEYSAEDADAADSAEDDSGTGEDYDEGE